MLGDVVCAEQAGAAVEGGHCRTDRRRRRADAPVRVAEDPRQGALAREPDEHGPPDPADPFEPPDELEVLVGRLPEADAGVEADVVLADTCRDGGFEPLFEKRRHLVDDVAVPRRHLHRARLSLHVHEAEIHTGVGGEPRQVRIAAKGRDVVDEHRPELDRSAGDGDLRGIDRHRLSAQRLQNRLHPAQLLVRRDSGGSGPGRLSPDVDDVGSLGELRPRRRSRISRVEVVASVGEAVGCDIHHPHHGGARPTLFDGRTSHETMERIAVRGTRRRALLGVCALVLLLVAVAIASSGSVPAGAAGTRRPADKLVDVLISLYLLLMVVGVGMWIYLLALRKDVVANSLANRTRRSPLVSFLTFMLAFGLLALFVRWMSVDESLRRRFAARIGRSVSSSGGPGSGTKGSTAYEPQFATGPVLVVLALVAIAVVAWYLSYRARRRRLEPMSDALLPVLADVLDETIDDLRAEADPRRAVIAAYARMERALGAYGLPRHPSEAPDEYLQRIFADLDVSRRATSRLTTLFSWAKFSGHDVAPEMKDEAIEALEAVRAELRAAEILAEQRRLDAQAELRERAGS